MPRGQLKSSRALADAAAGLALAVILILLVGYASSRFWIPDARLGLLLGYLA
ncbi:MAG: hypothetical protein JWL94_1924, partial [Microbacteriaceae bacterium]|nr:hypothetical protein [Microbacteriaceae bacterium]